MTLQRSVFLSGVELGDGSLLLGAQNGEFDIAATPHSIIKRRTPDGNWSDAGQTKWTSACVGSNAAGDGVILLGPYGRWLEFRMDGHAKGDVVEGVDEEDPPTCFRFLKAVAGELYAGGTDRFLFRQSASGWESLSPIAMTEHPEAGSVENLTGFGPDELYAVGWDGEIWSNEGGPWTRRNGPAHTILADADVSDGRVYVGGQMGVILEGRGNEWVEVENEAHNEDIWSVRAFKGAVYFSTTAGILRLRDGALTMAKPIGPDMRTSMSLFVGPSGLWSVGSSDIVVFDGEEWRTVAQS